MTRERLERQLAECRERLSSALDREEKLASRCRAAEKRNEAWKETAQQWKLNAEINAEADAECRDALAAAEAWKEELRQYLPPEWARFEWDAFHPYEACPTCLEETKDGHADNCIWARLDADHAALDAALEEHGLGLLQAVASYIEGVATWEDFASGATELEAEALQVVARDIDAALEQARADPCRWSAAWKAAAKEYRQLFQTVARGQEHAAGLLGQAYDDGKAKGAAAERQRVLLLLRRKRDKALDRADVVDDSCPQQWNLDARAQALQEAINAIDEEVKRHEQER